MPLKLPHFFFTLHCLSTLKSGVKDVTWLAINRLRNYYYVEKRITYIGILPGSLFHPVITYLDHSKEVFHVVSKLPEKNICEYSVFNTLLLKYWSIFMSDLCPHSLTSP